jgi:hypothetical protein
MKFNIYSLRGDISKYKDLLYAELGDVYYTHLVEGEAVIVNPFDSSKNIVEPTGYLENVEISSLEDFLEIFSKFERVMGDSYGHITVDVVNREVNILDSWIE